MKYLGINLSNYAQDLSTANYQTLLGKIKEDLNKWRDMLYSWIGILSIVEITIFSKLIYLFNVTANKIHLGLFCRN